MLLNPVPVLKYNHKNEIMVLKVYYNSLNFSVITFGNNTFNIQDKSKYKINFLYFLQCSKYPVYYSFKFFIYGYSLSLINYPLYLNLIESEIFQF